MLFSGYKYMAIYVIVIYKYANIFADRTLEQISFEEGIQTLLKRFIDIICNDNLTKRLHGSVCA